MRVVQLSIPDLPTSAVNSPISNSPTSPESLSSRLETMDTSDDNGPELEKGHFRNGFYP